MRGCGASQITLRVADIADGEADVAQAMFAMCRRRLPAPWSEGITVR